MVDLATAAVGALLGVKLLAAGSKHQRSIDERAGSFRYPQDRITSLVVGDISIQLLQIVQFIERNPNVLSFVRPHVIKLMQRSFVLAPVHREKILVLHALGHLVG